MENFFKNSVITQAISLGFDFEQFTIETDLQEVGQTIIEFFNENSEKLERIEDECEVTTSGRSQSVNYDDYSSSGEIVDFSNNWSKSPETKVYHSNFVMEQNGEMKNMNLYYLVGETDYNAPDGFFYSKKEKKHIKNEVEENYFAVYDKEDTYKEGECLENFNTENEASDFVINENAAYGYEKFYYEEKTINTL